MTKRTTLIILLVLMIHSGSCRSIVKNSNIISDGMDETSQSSVLELDLTATTVTCEPTYGFLPCTTVIWGQLFLIVVYECLLSIAGQYVSSGSDLFFKMFGTGIFGASLFHVLGTIPKVVLVLVAGFTGSTETLETRAAMGMGMLAGSAIMSLTLIWGSVVAFGSYDLSQDPTSSNVEKKKPFSLTGYGVKTDVETSYTARIMLGSMIPFVILQLAKIFNSSSGTRVVVLISLLITLAFLIIYCTYQVFEPWIQNRRLDYLLRKYLRKHLLSLLRYNGDPNVPVIREVFHKIDQNKNAYVSAEELRALILGIQIEGVGFKEDDYVEKIMEEFDVSGDANINETEFVKGVSKWVNDTKDSVKGQGRLNFRSKSSKEPTEEQQSLVAKKKKTKDEVKTWLKYSEAAFLVALGTALTILLGKPLMQTLREFATAANIPSFLVSYVVIPLALSFKQALGAIKSARHKTEKALSLTFSEIYGGVFMNNMMGLASFLALVYIGNLTWDVSAEVLAVLIICTWMGLLTSFYTKHPFWTSIMAYLLYPISLLLIYVLTSF